MLTIPDGYTPDDVGYNLAVAGVELTISGDASELYNNGKTESIGTALKENECNRIRGYKPETETKYRSAPELYTVTATSPMSRYVGGAEFFSTGFPAMSAPAIAI